MTTITNTAVHVLHSAAGLVHCKRLAPDTVGWYTVIQYYLNSSDLEHTCLNYELLPTEYCETITYILAHIFLKFQPDISKTKNVHIVFKEIKVHKTFDGVK